MAFANRAQRPHAHYHGGEMPAYSQSYSYGSGYGDENQMQLIRTQGRYRQETYNSIEDAEEVVIPEPPLLPQGQTVKLTCKGNTDFALGERDGRVVMVYFDPNDPTQQWIKDGSWSKSVRDSVGHPAFCLVNKATGKALRHAPAAYQQVLLTNYEPGSYEEAIMWSQSEDMGEGFKTIRMAHNIGLNLDCYMGDIKNGGIKEGTVAVLWTWNKQDNQLWKINPIY